MFYQHGDFIFNVDEMIVSTPEGCKMRIHEPMTLLFALEIIEKTFREDFTMTFNCCTCVLFCWHIFDGSSPGIINPSVSFKG